MIILVCGWSSWADSLCVKPSDDNVEVRTNQRSLVGVKAFGHQSIWTLCSYSVYVNIINVNVLTLFHVA